MKARAESPQPIFRGLGRREKAPRIGKIIQEIHQSGRCFLRVMKAGPVGGDEHQPSDGAQSDGAGHSVSVGRCQNRFSVLLEQSPSLLPFTSPQTEGG